MGQVIMEDAASTGGSILLQMLGGLPQAVQQGLPQADAVPLKAAGKKYDAVVSHSKCTEGSEDRGRALWMVDALEEAGL